MVIPDFPFDGNWVDCSSVVFGAIVVAIQGWRHRGTYGDSHCRFKAGAANFIGGMALFPQIMLLLCTFSSTFVHGVIEAGRVSLCIAGTYAVAGILTHDFASPKTPRQ